MGQETAAAHTALWHRAKAGDRDAADELVKAVLPLVSQHARRLAGRFHFADWEEMRDGALARLPKAIETYNPEAGTWCNYVATVVTRDIARRLGRRERKNARLPEVQHHPGLSESADEPAAPEARPALADRVAAAVAGLPPLERMAVELRSDYPQRKLNEREAARRIGIASRNLEALYGRAMKRLKTVLENDPAAG